MAYLLVTTDQGSVSFLVARPGIVAQKNTHDNRHNHNLSEVYLSGPNQKSYFLYHLHQKVSTCKPRSTG